MELLAANKNAFILLYVIAWRARRTNAFNQHNLIIREAFLGDFKDCGLTESEYRTAKKYLDKHQFATFRPTSKGTIATLINKGVFDVNLEDDDDQSDEQTTATQRPDNVQVDGQMTTNKNGKNVNKENNAQECVAECVSIGIEKNPPVVVDDEYGASSIESLLEDASPSSDENNHGWKLSSDNIAAPYRLVDALTGRLKLNNSSVDDLRQKFTEAEMAMFKQYRGLKTKTPHIRKTLADGFNRIIGENTDRYSKLKPVVDPVIANLITSQHGWDEINRKLIEHQFANTLGNNQDVTRKAANITSGMIFEKFPKQTNRVSAIAEIERLMRVFEPSYLFNRTSEFKEFIGQGTRFVPPPDKWYKEENFNVPQFCENWKDPDSAKPSSRAS